MWLRRVGIGALVVAGLAFGGGAAILSGGRAEDDLWTCQLWAEESAAVKAAHGKLALEIIGQLRRDSGEIYGLQPRLRASTSALANSLFGMDLSLGRAYATASVQEFALTANVVRATGLPPCLVALTVPIAAESSIDEASERLSRLTALLNKPN